MGTKRYRQVDEATGEAQEGFVAVVQPKRRNGFNGGWIAMNQGALKALAEIRSVDQTRVLFSLLSILDYENLIQIAQADLADELGMKRPNVNRAIKGLIERGALIEGPRIGRSRSYRLNPHFGWKGSAKNHLKALNERVEAKGWSVVDGGIRGDAHLQTDIQDFLDKP